MNRKETTTKPIDENPGLMECFFAGINSIQQWNTAWTHPSRTFLIPDLRYRTNNSPRWLKDSNTAGIQSQPHPIHRSINQVKNTKISKNSLCNVPNYKLIPDDLDKNLKRIPPCPTKGSFTIILLAIMSEKKSSSRIIRICPADDWYWISANGVPGHRKVSWAPSVTMANSAGYPVSSIEMVAASSSVIVILNHRSDGR